MKVESPSNLHSWVDCRTEDVHGTAAEDDSLEDEDNALEDEDNAMEDEDNPSEGDDCTAAEDNCIHNYYCGGG